MVYLVFVLYDIYINVGGEVKYISNLKKLNIPVIPMLS